MQEAKKIESQNSRILAYLQSGGSVTPLKALRLFKCLRLGSRINDLRNAGHSIATHMVKQNGKRFAKYTYENATENN